MTPSFETYLRKLRQTPLNEHTEHTGRAALEELLNTFASAGGAGKIAVQHEPKKVAEKGAPDFKIRRQGMILGYVETKSIGENLDKVLKSDQIARYKGLSQNIILTDYLHFVWINKNGVQRESLCHATDLENRKYRLRDDRVAAVSALLSAFFSTAPEGIGRAQQLALALAARSKLLRDYLGEELVRQERDDRKGRLFGLFQVFRDQVFHELTLKEFADAFAQMLAYGLFLARLNSGTHPVTLQNAREHVPGSFRLIRELVDFLTVLNDSEYRDVRWVVEEVLDKYKATTESNFSKIDWLKLDPVTPFYLFGRQDAKLRDEYEAHWRLSEIFPMNVLGFQTHRDAFAVSFSKGEMLNRLKEFQDPKVSDAELGQRYGLRSNRDWSLPDSRNAARAGKATPPQEVAYRPFDTRWSEFSRLTMDYPRRELLDHVAKRANIALLAPRSIGTKAWQHAFVAAAPANDCVISNRSREANQVFPLWRFENGRERQDNISNDFRKQLDSLYAAHYSAEEIFGYVYAVLHAPTYRARYAEFLRIDFPRIPLTKEPKYFETLSTLGWALMQGHLLRDLQRHGLAKYHGIGSHEIEAVRYSPREQTIHINKTQHFKPVPQAVWDFHIGGYQVLDKYLKSRKGRVLSLDEINHVGSIADSLAFTIEQMAKIDVAYKAAFGIRG